MGDSLHADKQAPVQLPSQFLVWLASPWLAFQLLHSTQRLVAASQQGFSKFKFVKSLNPKPSRSEFLSVELKECPLPVAYKSSTMRKLSSKTHVGAPVSYISKVARLVSETNTISQVHLWEILEP